jgi:hypothetical protein
MRTLPGLLSCALLAAAGACGGSADPGATKPDSPTGCAFVNVPAAAPGLDPNAAPEEVATTQARYVMDALIGRYLRGEVAVYRGTLSAHDHVAFADGRAEELGPDHDIPSGPALARLGMRTATESDWAPPKKGANGHLASLVIRAADSKRYVGVAALDSEPGTTFSTAVAEARQYAPLAGGCVECGPDLAGQPAAITFDGLTTTAIEQIYRDSHYVDVIVSTTVTARLTRVAPCDLRYEDIFTADEITGPEYSAPSLENGIDSGDEIVWHDTGTLGSPSGHQCVPITDYTIDRFVRKADLGVYGARNFVLGATRMVCAP